MIRRMLFQMFFRPDAQFLRMDGDCIQRFENLLQSGTLAFADHAVRNDFHERVADLRDVAKRVEKPKRQPVDST